jgi:hypothetical protein
MAASPKSHLTHLRDCFEEWLQINEFDYDYWFFTQAEWKRRGGGYLEQAHLVFGSESQLIQALNYGSAEWEEELQDLAGGFGYYLEFGEHWNFGFYPTGNFPPLPRPGSSYSELLRDSRWADKRKRIRRRSKGACEDCKQPARNLEVHHCYYRYGRLPWQYPDGALLHLCSGCHQTRARIELKLRGFLPTLRAAELEMLINSLRKLLYWYPRPEGIRLLEAIGHDCDATRNALNRLEPLKSHPEDR